MSFRNKLAFLAEAKKRHDRVAIVVAGEEGEDRADDAIDRLLKGRLAKRYSAIRVPKTKTRGKHEIDLVIASPTGIAALEVKHWGGDVAAQDDDHWIQEKSRGGHVTHRSPLRSNEKKLQDLLIYLEERKSGYPKDGAHSGVLLTNDNVGLARDLANHPSVLRMEDLTAWIRPRVLPKTGLVSRLVGRNRNALKEKIKILDQLPTWDTIFLHGGRRLKGDVVEKGVRTRSGDVVTRRETRHVKFHIPRTKLGLVKPPKVSWRDITENDRKRQAPLETDQTISIKISGRGQTETVPVAWITAIEFGWQDESYYDAPKPPLESYEGKVFSGTVTGVQEYGVFVDLDSHRDGLVHVRRLRDRGRSPESFSRGDGLKVKVLGTEVKHGKERIDLDLA